MMPSASEDSAGPVSLKKRNTALVLPSLTTGKERAALRCAAGAGPGSPSTGTSPGVTPAPARPPAAAGEGQVAATVNPPAGSISRRSPELISRVRPITSSNWGPASASEVASLRTRVTVNCIDRISSARRRAVRSVTTTTTSSRSAQVAELRPMSAGKVVPSALRTLNSMPVVPDGRWVGPGGAPRRWRTCAARSGAGTSTSTGAPIRSVSACPVIDSSRPFTKRMRPRRSTRSMPSGIPRTSACASSASSSGARVRVAAARRSSVSAIMPALSCPWKLIPSNVVQGPSG